MKLTVQRVEYANLKVDGKLVSEIGHGFLAFLGVEVGDTETEVNALADKLARLRVFSDENGKMNLSVKDAAGEVLLVSQFTLCADCSHGNRPSFTLAAPPSEAERLYNRFTDKLAAEGVPTKNGVFGADMKITLLNDGPVTINLECKNGKIL